jgi:hypothetical protein
MAGFLPWLSYAIAWRLKEGALDRSHGGPCSPPPGDTTPPIGSSLAPLSCLPGSAGAVCWHWPGHMRRAGRVIGFSLASCWPQPPGPRRWPVAGGRRWPHLCAQCNWQIVNRQWSANALNDNRQSSIVNRLIYLLLRRRLLPHHGPLVLAHLPAYRAALIVDWHVRPSSSPPTTTCFPTAVPSPSRSYLDWGWGDIAAAPSWRRPR